MVNSYKLIRQKALAERATLQGRSFNWRQYSALREGKLKLTPFQKEAVVGLLLSDANMQLGAEKRMRLKIQQSEIHKKFLEHIKFELLQEYSGSDILNPVSSKRKTMFEFDTLMCTQFNEIAKLFYGNSFLNGNDERLPTKSIYPEIKPYITPVSLAYWFMGDGGKLSPEGKAISLHSQGFTKEENEFLASCICDLNFEDNLKLYAQVNLDYTQNEKEFYRIDISGPSFKCFIDEVSPYIIESMCEKLPDPRKEGSRFSLEKPDIRSSYFKGNSDWLFTYKVDDIV